MTRFLPDTSCLVAALCSWHEHHERSAREFERRLEAGEVLVVSAPVLVETYAVLDASFLGDKVEMIALKAEDHARLLRRAPERAIAGSPTYGAVIADCAVAASADVILTFSKRHGLPLANQGSWSSQLDRVAQPAHHASTIRRWHLRSARGPAFS